MQFNWSIDIANIITAIGFLISVFAMMWKFYGSFIAKTTAFEDLLKEHAQTLLNHANRMEKQDDLLISLVGDVQRLVGRMEATHIDTIRSAATEAARVIERATETAERVISVAAEKRGTAA